MSKQYSQRWAYGFATILFFLVAAINTWMIISEGSTTFRIVAAVAFAIGGLLLLVKWSRAGRPRV